MEVLGPCFMLTMGSLVLAFIVYNAMHERDKWNAALTAASESLGITARPGSWQKRGTARGTVSEVEVIIDTYTTGGGKNSTRWTRWRLTDPHGPRAEIGSESALSYLGKALHGEDLQIGDRAFDDQVLIRSDHEVDLRARLDGLARAGVMNAVSNDWTLTDGEWMHRERGLVTNAFALETIAQSGVDLCFALRLRDSVPDSLRAIVTTDPEFGVRVRALELWLRQDKPADEALEQIIDANDDLVGLMAARALGHPGRIARFLGHRDPAVRVQAAIIASAGGSGSSAIEAGLCDGLALEQWTDRCIERLGQVASVGAVQALTPLTEGLMPSARRRTAAAAIAAIQGRRQGASAGQISIVEVQGGELSVGEVQQRGQLSESRKRQTE